MTDTGPAHATDTITLLGAFVDARRMFFQGVLTYDETVAVAAAYIAAVQARKDAEPSRFRGLAVPTIAKLMRG